MTYSLKTVLRYRRFKKKNLWKFVDADWYFWFQCVDLCRFYCREVFNYNMGRLPYAKDATLEKTFPWRKELEIGVDTFYAWDIIIFGETNKNKAGHIAIVDKQVSDWIRILEQNGVGWWTEKPWNEIRLRLAKRWNVKKVFRYVR